MRAAIFKGADKPVAIENIADPTPGPDEVVVKVGRCGICGSDVHMTGSHTFSPAPGTPLGHEVSGEVVALGSAVTELKLGDRISAMPMAGCGTCVACLAGHPYACSQWRMMWGGFSEYALAKAAFATRLPAALSLADGALVEPLACGLRAVTMSRLVRGARVLILGAGAIGLAAAFWSRRLGAGKIVVTARSPWRETMALGIGASAFVVSDEDLASNVNEALAGSPDIVFEAIGMPGAIMQAIELVRPRGTVLAAGACMQTDHFVPFLAMLKEVCVQFMAAYTLDDFRFTVDTLESGALEPRGMITDTLPLAALPAVLESLRGSNRQCKVHIDPWLSQ